MTPSKRPSYKTLDAENRSLKAQVAHLKFVVSVWKDRALKARAK